MHLLRYHLLLVLVLVLVLLRSRVCLRLRLFMHANAWRPVLKCCTSHEQAYRRLHVSSNVHFGER